jgi:ferritin-like metal-binding protein YciE
MIMPNTVYDTMIQAADELGWNRASQILVLQGFIEEERERDPKVMERFKSFINSRVEEENSYGLEKDDENEEDDDEFAT